MNCTVQFHTGGVGTPERIEVVVQHVLGLIDRTTTTTSLFSITILYRCYRLK